MRYIFSLIVLLSLSCSEKVDCSNFRTGVFQDVQDGIVLAEIERTEVYQIETFDKSKVVKLKIAWLDDCTYKLNFIEANEAFWKEVGKETPMPDLVVRILENGEDYYIQESSIEGEKDGFKNRSRIIKI